MTSFSYAPYLVGAVAIAVSVLLYLNLRKANAALAAAQSEASRLKVLAELSEEVGRFGTWHLDSVADKLTWSDNLIDMVHRPHPKGSPTFEEAFGYMHPEQRQFGMDLVTHALNEGEDFEFRAFFITETGEDLLVLARGTCQFDRNGKVIGAFGCVVDLGEHNGTNSLSQLLIE